MKHPTTVPKQLRDNDEDEQSEDTATMRAEALQSALEERCHAMERSFVTDEDEVFVKTSQDNVHNVDWACLVAYDHGFVPRGFTADGAVRFKPREEL